MRCLEVTGACRSFGPIAALDDVSIDADVGEIVVLSGPSGSGKSTLVRSIAGLERLDRGRIELRGRDVTRDSPRSRDVGLVFQDHALFPHLTVAQNIGFGLRARRTSRALTATRVGEAAQLLRLDHLLGRLPAELSGGERQRVGVARAIARQPDLLLLDEPLSNLDPELRVETRLELRALQRRLGVTMVYVTHDPAEAMTLADRIFAMVDGRIVQSGTPSELYHRPRTPRVARLFRNPPMNVASLRTLTGDPDAEGLAGIRAEHLRVDPAGPIDGTVVTREEAGAASLAWVRVGAEQLAVRTGAELAEGAQVRLRADPDQLVRFQEA